MTYLRRLVIALTLHERKLVRQFLSCFDPNFSDHNRVKTLSLFDILIKNPQLELEKVSLLLYGKVQPDALKFVRLRLIDKIQECLLLNLNTGRAGVYAPVTRSRTEVQKKLLQVRLLLEKDLPDGALATLPAVIRQAKKFELYGAWLAGLQLLQEVHALRDDWKAHARLDADALRVASAAQLLQGAQRTFAVLQREARLTCFPREAASPEVAATLAALDRHLEAGGSARLGFWRYRLQVQRHVALGQTDVAIGCSLALIAHLRVHPLLHLPEHFREAYQLLAELHLAQGDSEDAHIALRLASQHGKAGQPDARQLELEARLHLDNARPARALSLLKQPTGQLSELQAQRNNYVQAAACFQLGRFPEAMGLLKDTVRLRADKSGWNIGIRVLTLQLHLEMNRMDLAENEVDTFRKHLRRVEPQHLVPKRYKLILQVLQQLIRHNCAYAAVTQLPAFQELSRSGAHAGVFQPERINFVAWLTHKTKLSRNKLSSPLPSHFQAAPSFSK